MKPRPTEVALIVILVFALSFVFNFVWEALHSVYLFEDHDFSSERYVMMVISASARDGLIILAMYFGVSAASRKFLWVSRREMKWVLSFVLLGLIVAAVLEYRAVYLKGIWAYNFHMPTLLGIGVSPLVQISITGILAIGITGRLLCREE
ncbi:MAG: hypothetical protein ABIJ00_00095 [Candidatus Eisenbacteria bacterium]